MTDTSRLRVNGARLWQSIMDMAKIGPGEHGGSCRLALSDEDKQGRDRFLQWAREAGCSISIDDMGNIFARRAGQNNALDPIVAGSHLDTQPHGGRFDGVYGVLAALEVVRTLNDARILTAAPLEIVVWTNEEGSRFAPAMISSGVYAGLFEKEFAWSRRDSDGLSLLQELTRIGYLGDEACGDHPMAALFEAHIEQGPVLEHNNTQIGVVIGAQGQRWYDVVVTGKDSHAGPTPMPGRQDALVASADIICKIQAIALAHYGVATVGEIHASPNSRNTIPGEVMFTVDMRNPADEALATMDECFREFCAACALRHRVNIQIEEIWTKPAVKFDQHCIAAVSTAVSSLGYSNQPIVSGAGHDACQVCEVVPTAMIFVPCAGGVSHNEAESAEPEDLEAGANVLLHAMLRLALKS